MKITNPILKKTSQRLATENVQKTFLHEPTRSDLQEFLGGYWYELIRMTGANKQSVIDNTITLNNNNPGRGISLQGSNFVTVSCNNILGSTSEDHIGLNVLSSISGEFLTNNFNGTETGARFQSDCNDTNFRTNTFEGNDISLLISPTAVMDDPIIGPQTHQGNIWDDNSIAKHEGTDENILLSQFIVHDLNSEFAPDFIINGLDFPIGNWFDEDEAGSPEQANPADCDLLPFVGGGTTDLDKELARDNVSIEVYNDEVKWVAEKNLYRKLDDDLSLLSTDADFQTFYNTKSSESIGEFTSIDKESLAIHETDASTSGQITSLKSVIESHRNQLKSLENSISDNPTEAELNDLKIAQALVYSQIATAEEQLKSLNYLLKSGKEVSSEDTRISNVGINVVEVYEQNEKIVNSIYLRTVARGNTNLTSSEVSQLWVIASECPLAGGNAVFRARSLYALVDATTTFDDDEICNAAGIVLLQRPNETIIAELKGDKTVSKEEGEILESSNFSIQPNPASSNLSIQYTIPSDTSGEIIVYDLMGRIVKQKLLTEKSANLILDVNDWQEGIYWVELKLDNGSNTIQKVSILR